MLHALGALLLLGLVEETPQTTALRVMQKVLREKDWAGFYEKHAHPHLKDQLDLERFRKFMDGDKGKAIVTLFDEVLKAVDDKADESVLIARHNPENKDEYEYILVKVQKSDRKGRQWHLELQLDGGQWKLMDTD